jgi:hypothetical protein
MNFQDIWETKNTSIKLKELETLLKDIADSNNSNLLDEYLASMLESIYGERLVKVVERLLYHRDDYAESDVFVLCKSGGTTEIAGNLPDNCELVFK